MFQLANELAAQPIEFTHGQQDVALKLILQLAQLKRCAAQTAKLFRQSVGVKRLPIRVGQRHQGIGLDHVTSFIASNHAQWLAGGPIHFDRNRALEPGQVSGKCFPQGAFKFRVAGFPDAVAWVNTIEINVAASKNKQGCGGRSLGSLNTRLSAGETPGGPDLINPSTLFFFFWLAAVENEAVATFERAFQQDEYAFA